MRRVVSNFYTNVRTPVTMVNDLLQGNPRGFFQSTGALCGQYHAGLPRLFSTPPANSACPGRAGLRRDPGQMGRSRRPPSCCPSSAPPAAATFSACRWITGSIRCPGTPENDFRYEAQRLPTWFYLVTLRPAAWMRGLLEGASIPRFHRDATSPRRLYDIYDGNPPLEIIQQMQGSTRISIRKNCWKSNRSNEHKDGTTHG